MSNHPSSFSLFSVCIVSFFYKCSQDFLFITGFEILDYGLPLCSFLYVSCVWSLLCFLDLRVYGFHPNLEIFFEVIPSDIFSCPPSFLFWGP